MGYVLRVRFASFFAGAAAASAVGLYVLHNDYKAAHQAISQQVVSFSSIFYVLLIQVPSNVYARFLLKETYLFLNWPSLGCGLREKKMIADY